MQPFPGFVARSGGGDIAGGSVDLQSSILLWSDLISLSFGNTQSRAGGVALEEVPEQ